MNKRARRVKQGDIITISYSIDTLDYYKIVPFAIFRKQDKTLYSAIYGEQLTLATLGLMDRKIKLEHNSDDRFIAVIDSINMEPGTWIIHLEFHAPEFTYTDHGGYLEVIDGSV